MEAPFYVGQKVVRVKCSRHGKKGQVYTVKNIRQCRTCKKWAVDIGDKERVIMYNSVCNCGSKYFESKQTRWYHYSSFAPIDEQYTDITTEIAKESKETHEIHDQPARILKPEKVN